MNLSPSRSSPSRRPAASLVCLVFSALLFLATIVPQVRAQADASTASNGDTSTPTDPTTDSTGTTNSGGGGGGDGGGSGGSTPSVPLIDFGYYTCGGQKVGSNRGQYLNGENWEVPGIPDYIDDQDPTLLSGSGNITYAPAATSRGYPQCWGRNQLNNCFDKWAPTAEAPRRVFCETSDPNANFVKGDQGPPLCLVYGGGNRLFKMKFYPIVDQFALLQIQDSFNGSALAHPSLQHLGTAFQVEMVGFASDYKHRFSYVQSSECVDQFVNGTRVGCTIGGVSCIVVPFHTIVITLDHGAMKSIEWDDDCSLCRNDYCVDGNCANDVSQCTTSPIAAADAATDCDFKLYVSWAGTDSQGTFLSSSQKRLSQFRRWSLNSVYNQASNWDIGSLPIAPPDQSSANIG